MTHARPHASRPEAPVRFCQAVATVALGCGVVALTSCAHDGRSVGDDNEFPTRIVTPACADAHPPITLELLRVSRDLRPRKPSKDVRHYLADLRIQLRGQMDLWLLVDEDVFPSAVDSVHPDVDESRDASVEPEAPRETWWFSGNHIVRAWPLGRASETSLTNIGVTTGNPRIPVSLGTIDVDGLSPQEWVRRTGGSQPRDASDPRAPAAFEPHCTTWFDLTN